MCTASVVNRYVIPREAEELYRVPLSVLRRLWPLRMIVCLQGLHCL